MGSKKPTPLILPLIFGLTAPLISEFVCELAGVIDDVGKEVQLFKPGDRVLGMNVKTFGAYAEYKCLSEESPLAVIPDTLTFEEAVAVCDGGATALTFLRDKAKS